MRDDGYDVVVVSDAQKSKLDEQYRGGDIDLRTMEGFIAEYNDSFSYRFVEHEQLTGAERAVFDRRPDILALVGVRSETAPPIRISETMRVGLDTTAASGAPNCRASSSNAISSSPCSSSPARSCTRPPMRPRRRRRQPLLRERPDWLPRHDRTTSRLTAAPCRCGMAARSIVTGRNGGEGAAKRRAGEERSCLGAT